MGSTLVGNNKRPIGAFKDKFTGIEVEWKVSGQVEWIEISNNVLGNIISLKKVKLNCQTD